MSFKAITVNTPPEQAAHILAEDDAAIYEALIGADRVMDIGSKLAATVITNNKVRISDGVAVVGGHAGRIVKGDYEDMTIENGASGKKRNDLICARFQANGSTDTYKLVVIKGAAGTTATDPTIVSGNLYNGDNQRDFPLWRVRIEGLSITKVEQLFTVSNSSKYLTEKTDTMQNSLNQLNSNITNISNNIAGFKSKKFTISTGKTGIYLKVPQTDWAKCVAFVVGCNNIDAALMGSVLAYYDPNVSQFRIKTQGNVEWSVDQNGQSVGTGTSLASKSELLVFYFGFTTAGVF
ncbi:hypothetical protein RHL97_19180 [Clostridioides difficile]|nr:hypothetical protein [Clostridioides difficile]